MMPTGIPVATVAVDGAVNAALIAIQILGVTDADLATKLDAKRAADAEKVLQKNAAVEAEFNK
jgi:5-(carboxyamino)imidazole ribonucleotide mutase